MTSLLLLLAALVIVQPPLFAATIRYHLTVTENPDHKMNVNGESPGPVLRFTEGDQALITVHNGSNEPTSLHWHGVLVPNSMDGVPGLTTPEIKPGADFTYAFPLRQSGTYWYHSHADLEEQDGVYGAIVIEPAAARAKTKTRLRDQVVVLSDFTHEDAREVMHTLKRGGDWSSIKKGTVQSLIGAIRSGHFADYFNRELLRMPPMDISDVAYDAFLANGKRSLHISSGTPGSLLRLRLINASSMTYFHLAYAGGPLTILAADGQEVQPVQEDSLLIAAGETYDLRFTIPESGSDELRATAQDGSGHASIWLGEGTAVRPAPAMPAPDLYAWSEKPSWKTVFALTPQGAMNMSDARVKAGDFDRPTQAPSKMDMSAMGDMMSEPVDSPSPYADLKAKKPAAFKLPSPDRIFRFTLDGDMNRYVWFLNNRPLRDDNDLVIKKGEVVRFILINRTMMHHPMHLHGHLFRVINGQGAYSPLKHTVDVAPMSTTVIEFKADEAGDWYFHCHFLYHMMSGMGRVVHYAGFKPDEALKPGRHEFYHDPWSAWANADLLSQMTLGSVTAANTYNSVSGEWKGGWARAPRAAWESLFSYDRYVNRFFGVLAGADLFGRGTRPFARGRLVGGFHYLLPLLFTSRVWIDSDGGARLSLSRELPLLARWRLHLEGEYDTHEFWSGRFGLTYIVAKNQAAKLLWDSDFGWGAGLSLGF